jgi:phosphoglycolate phosphatase
VKPQIIFDLDGTLVDSCAICVDILQTMLLDRGSNHQIDPDFARPYMSHGGQAMVSALLGPACVDAAEDLAEFRTRYGQTPTPMTALFPGVAEALAKLHAAGYTLSICSNKPQNLCDQVLRDTGLADLFTVVVGGQSDLRPKPAPDLVEHTLHLLGADIGDCVFIGDSELDHQVATSLGMLFKFVTYGYATQGWHPDDSDCFDCFPTLFDALARSSGQVVPFAPVGKRLPAAPLAARRDFG